LIEYDKDLKGAVDTYKNLQSVYTKMKNGDKVMYAKILEFYGKIEENEK